MNSDLNEKLKMLYKVQRRIDELNQEKNQLKNEVERLIIDQKMEDKKFSVGDRCISYTKKTTTQPITQKYLSVCLEDYYQGDASRANKLYDFIISNRPKSARYQLDITKKK